MSRLKLDKGKTCLAVESKRAAKKPGEMEGCSSAGIDVKFAVDYALIRFGRRSVRRRRLGNNPKGLL